MTQKMTGAEMVIKAKQFGLDTYLSPRQIAQAADELGFEGVLLLAIAASAAIARARSAQTSQAALSN